MHVQVRPGVPACWLKLQRGPEEGHSLRGFSKGPMLHEKPASGAQGLGPPTQGEGPGHCDRHGPPDGAWASWVTGLGGPLEAKV